MYRSPNPDRPRRPIARNPPHADQPEVPVPVQAENEASVATPSTHKIQDVSNSASSSRDPRFPRRAPTRAEALLQEYTQNKRASELARSRDPLQSLAEISKRLGANSGMIVGPALAKPTISATRSSSSYALNVKRAANLQPAPAIPTRMIGTDYATVPLPVKSAVSPKLSWQDQDDLREIQIRSNKRNRDAGGLGEDEEPIQRMARMRIANVRRPVAARPQRDNDTPVKRPPKAHLSPRFLLKGEGDDGDSLSDSDDETQMEVDEHPRRAVGPGSRDSRMITKVVSLESLSNRSNARTTPTPVSRQPLLRKAARKIGITATDSESDDDIDESDESAQSSDELKQETEDRTPDDAPSETPPLKVEEEDNPRFFGPPELVILDSPPHIKIPLPQLAPEYQRDRKTSNFHPSLVSALENLTFGSLASHQRRQLPFLIRNLRRGFVLRCRALGVSLKRDKRDVVLQVRYEHIDNIHNEILLSHWQCPICSLHNLFPNRQTLKKHLDWDHPEFFIEWKRQYDDGWIINILVPQTIPLDTASDSIAEAEESVKRELSPTSSRSLSYVSDVEPPINRRDSLFPFVALSPPPSYRASPSSGITSLPPISPSPRTSASPAPTVSPTPPNELKGKRPMYPPPLPRSNLRFPSASSTAQSSTTASSTTATGSSSTATTATERRMPASQFFGPDGRQYPAPPPPEDPLGPASQPPYLPAEPDYPDGQTVHYSCRPGGPYLYDLIDTLPMEPFGVLGWYVLDKEEEIFDSDEVPDNHKVMLALWSRWILLNRRVILLDLSQILLSLRCMFRRRFIANYQRGVKAFIDEYWKIIHRAAGWDALRYLLLILHANRFLTVKEMATTLKHYEGYTGMDHWYS